MREQILSYLKNAGKPLPATQILQDVLHACSPNETIAARVLEGIVGNDCRFVNSGGLWTARAASLEDSPSEFAPIALLFLEGAALDRQVRGAIYLEDEDSNWGFEIDKSAPSEGLRTMQQVREKLDNHLVLVWSPKDLLLWKRLLRNFGLDARHFASMCLRNLAVRTLNRAGRSLGPEDLAAELDLPAPDSNAPIGMARFYFACFRLMLERVPLESRANPEALRSWIEAGHPRVDFSRFGFGPEMLDGIPESPGVYIMRNRANAVVYVGKSRNLRRRVRSYFTSSALTDAKVARIHQQLHSIEAVTTRSEVEALLMEMRLISDFRPSINLQAEIHEKSGTYAKDRNLLLLVPREGEDKAQIYFLRDGCFVAQETVMLGRAPSKKVRQRICSTYFGSRQAKKQDREPWEIELVLRWLGANRRRLNYLDIDEMGSLEAVVGSLARYLKDPAKLREKVHYR